VSEKAPISDAVRIICRAHFDEENSGCSRCPIRSACHSSPTMNVTYDGLNEWRIRMNEAAEAHLATPTKKSP